MSLLSQNFASQILTGAAPLGSERRIATSQNSDKQTSQQLSRRRRRRGPRSQKARILRSARHRCGPPAVATSGKSEVDAAACTIQPEFISLMSINIRSILGKIAELQYHLQERNPDFVFIQETWLDKSVEELPEIAGYYILSRRDREDDSGRGGILTLARNGLSNVVFLKHSEYAERSWHALHSDVGIYILGNWYRPPGSDHLVIQSFDEELAELSNEAIGFVIMGDMNVHHSRWLFHSNGITAEGRLLKEVCESHGLLQIVREPTRNQYLLDLCLTDIAHSKASIGPQIADHRMVSVKIPAPYPKTQIFERKVWFFRKAAWANLRCELHHIDWAFLRSGDFEKAFNDFQDCLMILLERYIPRGIVQEKRQSHPWLNDRCKKIINTKNQAEGTQEFPHAQQICSDVLHEEYREYVRKLRAEIASLSKNDKRWWSLNRELLNQKAKISRLAPLKDADGKWHLDSRGKANLLAKTWYEKFSLPAEIDDPYFGGPELHMAQPIILRTRTTEKILRSLDIKKATGPDHIGALILRTLARELAIPLTILFRRMLQEGKWPSRWKLHFLVPIFKRGSAYLASNYRGVHLTPIMSKIAERVIGAPLVNYLSMNYFGENQWAYTKKRSSRDLVTLCVASWILAICTGFKVAGYLSDISGAFDKVFKPFLLAKLYRAGIGDEYLRFLSAYLEPRSAKVVVENEASDPFALEDTVFQGTVLGPTLWNVFFSDVAQAATQFGGQEAMFADDLNVFRQFDRLAPFEEVAESLEKTKGSVHAWGRRNRVTFDASKEHIVVIHPDYGIGDDFKFLGTWIDAKLQMHSCIDQILHKIRPKIKALLRTRAHYGLGDMITQFKTHVWSLMEFHNGAIAHAAPSKLNLLDQAQSKFLRELHSNDIAAFLDYNFAPPSLRRDIGLLGLLHKRVLGLAHPAYEALFPWTPYPSQSGHSKQIYDHMPDYKFRRIMFCRSLFGMADIYNHLPQYVVDSSSVSEFQSELTRIAKARCSNGLPNWQHTFSTSVHVLT